MSPPLSSEIEHFAKLRVGGVASCKLFVVSPSLWYNGCAIYIIKWLYFYFLPVDIQHTQCSCRIFSLERFKLCDHKLIRGTIVNRT